MTEIFKIIDTFDKGRGAFASKNLSKGTIILKEQPLVCAEDAYDALYQLYNTDSDTDDDFKKTQQRNFETLTPHVFDNTILGHDEIKEHLTTLPIYMREFFTNIKPHKLRLLIAKFYRNAFRNNTSISAPASAVLIKGALLNHSCCNNVDFQILPNGNFIFETNREIIENEELCITYLDTTLSTKKRQSRLQSQYNFTCICTKC